MCAAPQGACSKKHSLKHSRGAFAGRRRRRRVASRRRRRGRFGGDIQGDGGVEGGGSVEERRAVASRRGPGRCRADGGGAHGDLIGRGGGGGRRGGVGGGDVEGGANAKKATEGGGGLRHATCVADLGLSLTTRTGIGEITLSLSERAGRRMRVAGDLARWEAGSGGVRKEWACACCAVGPTRGHDGAEQTCGAGKRQVRSEESKCET